MFRNLFCSSCILCIWDSQILLLSLHVHKIISCIFWFAFRLIVRLKSSHKAGKQFIRSYRCYSVWVKNITIISIQNFTNRGHENLGCWSKIADVKKSFPVAQYWIYMAASLLENAYKLTIVKKIANSVGVRRSPCFTSDSTETRSSIFPLTHTYAFILCWRDRIRPMNFSKQPSFNRFAQRIGLLRVSKSFVWSIEH